jgi:hypothetical protein
VTISLQVKPVAKPAAVSLGCLQQCCCAGERRETCESTAHTNGIFEALEDLHTGNELQC